MQIPTPLAVVVSGSDVILVAAMLVLAVMLFIARHRHQEMIKELVRERTLRARAGRRHAEVSALYDTSNLLNLHVERKRLLETACQRVAVSTDASLAAVLLMSEDRSALELAGQASHGASLESFRIPVDNGFLGRIARYGKGVSVHSSQLSHSQQRQDAPLRSAPYMIAVPIRVRAEILGVLLVCCKDDPAPVGRLSTVSIFAESIGWVLERQRNLTEIERKWKSVDSTNRELIDQNRKGEVFLATAIHELRTPLSGIVSYAEVLAEYYDTMQDTERRLLSRDLNDQCKSMMGLVNELFDFARLESGRLALDVEETQIGELVKSALELIEPRAAEQRITLERRVASAAVVKLDRTKIRQCVLNLVANALKFTEPEGAVTIEVVDAEGGVEIAVSDTGRGIEPAELEQIFELYRSAATRKSATEKGLGLGLYLVKSFVELHEGKVQVSSAVGKGSTFRFYLPLEGPKISQSNQAEAA